jgi:glycosyltransferase involved in cell wall biosynthesis
MYGAQRHAVESMKNHLINGHGCLVISGTDGYATTELKNLGIEVITIGSLRNSYNPILDFQAIKAIIKIINEYKPHLVISHSSKAGVIARIACYNTKTPNIFTVQGWPFEEGTPKLQKIIAICIERLLIPFSDSYMCVSEYTRKFGLSKLPLKKERLYVCPNMHPSNKVTPSYTKNHTYNILMVAGFREQKDHITALKALLILKESNTMPKIHFTFAGDGPKRNEIEAFILKNNLREFVTLAGETKEIEKFYDQADIVILPTFYEGLPLSLLEALQKAKPLIATDTGGINEIIFDGINGHLLKLKDAESLANHILSYYKENKIPQLSANAKKVYDTYFSYEIIAYTLNEVINKALSNSKFTASSQLNS